MLSSFLLALPADATELQFWRFESQGNRLTFTTDEGVQPRAQLIPNPTRIVIDLPGTRVGNVVRTQPVGGAIREVRVGQFDAETTRIVIEMAPGFTIDPQQVRVRGTTPTQWSVQLPTPQRIAIEEQPPISPPPTSTVPSTGTRLEGVQVTGDGLFVRTTGPAPTIETRQERGRSRLIFELANTTLSPTLAQRDIPVNRHGVSRVRLSQVQGNPPAVRVTLELTGQNFNWQASNSGFGGVVLLPPRSGLIGRPPSDRQPPVTPPPLPPPPNDRPLPPRDRDPLPPINPPLSRPDELLATVLAVELSANGQQLIVRTDQPIRYDGEWDRREGAFRIILNGARLSDRTTGPQLGAGSPLQQIRLRQEDRETVVVLVRPAPGVRLGDLNQPEAETLTLALRGNALPPRQPDFPSEELPRPDSRRTVVIDPGHGGIDPGAIGIGGLREVDVLWPISMEVRSILERQGVRVVLTRTTDRTVELEPRVQIANNANADVFVSIHANAISMQRPDVNGVETFFASPSGQVLAQTIQNSIVEMTGMRDRGAKSARFYVIRNTTMPAALVEVGFVTGAEDAPRLRDPQFRSLMARAIARGILQYLQRR